MLPLEQELLAFVSYVYSAMQWPGVVVLMAIESVFIPLPSEIIMPLAGWMLIKEPGLPVTYILLAGVYGALGGTIGAIIIYLVGMWGGRPFLEKYGKYVLISRHDLAQADQWFARQGSWAVFFCRLLPVVRSLISLPAGIARMPIVKFLIYTFLGSFLWSAGLAYGGYQLGERWEQLRTFLRPFDPLIGVLLIALIAFYLYRHLKQAKKGDRTRGLPS